MLSNINGDLVKKVWHKDFFNASKSNLKNDDYQVMIDELNRLVQECIDKGTDVVVSSFIPGSNWSGTVWQPIYNDACRWQEDHSAMFFGLLVCQVLIDREETWYFLKQENAKGMTYFKPKKKDESSEVGKFILNRIDELTEMLENEIAKKDV